MFYHWNRRVRCFETDVNLTNGVENSPAKDQQTSARMQENDLSNDFAPFSTSLVIWRRPVRLSVFSWSFFTSTPHNILSRPLFEKRLTTETQWLSAREEKYSTIDKLGGINERKVQ